MLAGTGLTDRPHDVVDVLQYVSSPVEWKRNDRDPLARQTLSGRDSPVIGQEHVVTGSLGDPDKLSVVGTCPGLSERIGIQAC